MDVISFQEQVLSAEADVIVIGVCSSLELGPQARTVDEASGGAIRRLIACEEITGKAAETTVVLAPAGLTATHVVVVGLGDANDLDAGVAFRSMSAAIRAVSKRERNRVLFAIDGWSDGRIEEAAVSGAIVGGQGQDLYRAEKKRISPKAALWAGVGADICHRGQILGESVNLTRHMVNQPAQDMYPESFAQEAASLAAKAGLEIEVWDEQRLEQERCQALLAVSRGSARAPRLVIARHRGAEATAPTLALVGKGVTFDSGGLSLKPSDGMKTMKCDMAGAATVLGALQAIAKLKLPVNVVGIMGLVENMVGPRCYKLGDVLTARNGRTIEVHNTDAEGRLVLADALCVAVDMGVSKLIDVATLTGACVVALGMDVAGLMSNNAPWCAQVKSAATRCGESAWELPMFADYGQQIRSEVADIKNTGDGRWGGAITAAKFLEEFVSDVPWVHIDIAGPSFLEKPKPWLDAGGSGVMVRTLVELVRDFV